MRIDMKQSRHKIKEIQEGSIAQELELEAGDELISINGQSVEDVFDYHYLVNDEYIELLIEKADGEIWELEVEKDYDEDLGIEFENGLMDEYPDNFSFYEKFERIERALLGRNRWNVYDEMQDRAKKLVGKLLREQFSDTRQKVEIKEKVVLRNSKSIRI